MAGYKIGTQAWYDATRRRLVEISKELRNPGVTQAKKDQLYSEQGKLMGTLQDYATDNLVNNPIE